MSLTFSEQKAFERGTRVQWLITLAKEAGTLSAAAEMAGKDKGSLHRMYEEYCNGFERAKAVVRRGTHDTRLKMYQHCSQQGMTLSEVSDIMGVTKSAVIQMEKSHDGLRFERDRAQKIRVSCSPSAISKSLKSPRNTAAQSLHT